ncbi:MAG: porin, partial [Pseudomonadota bacterium]
MALKWGVLSAAILLPGAASAVEIETDASAVLALSALDEDGAANAAGALFSVGVSAEVSHLFENGVELGAALGVRLDDDNDARPGFAGRLGDCAPGLADCASLGGPAAGLAPQSPTTGLSSFGAPLDAGPYGAIEAGYIYVKSGWGEGSVGRDIGAAVRLDARAPSVFAAASALSPSLDPTGANIVRARNDVSGVAPKATYLTPRIIGFRFGVSYTPSAEGRGVDWNTRSAGAGVAAAEIEDVFEAAASFSRRFRESGTRLRVGATASFGRDGSRFAEYGDYRAYGLGLELERDAWRLGGRWLTSNNAWDAGSGDYQAFEIGVVREFEDWSLGVEYGA